MTELQSLLIGGLSSLNNISMIVSAELHSYYYIYLAYTKKDDVSGIF